MKVTFPRRSLHAALSVVAGAAPRRKPFPERAVLLCAGPSLSVQAWDGHTTVAVTVPEAVIDENGRALVELDKLAGYIAKRRDDQMELVVGKTAAAIGGDNFASPAFRATADEREILTVPRRKPTVTIDAAILLAAINRAVVASHDQDGKFAFSRCMFTVRQGGIELATTDGERISIIRQTAKTSDAGRQLVPVRALRLVAKLLDRSDSARVWLDEWHTIHFETQAGIVRASSVRNDDGKKFPQDIESAIPTAAKIKVVVTARDLAEHVAPLAAFDRLVTLWTPDGRSLRADKRSAKLTEDDAKSQCEAAKNQQAATVENKRLIEFLKLLPASAEITVRIAGEEKPVVFEHSGGLYVMAPATP